MPVAVAQRQQLRNKWPLPGDAFYQATLIREYGFVFITQNLNETPATVKISLTLIAKEEI